MNLRVTDIHIAKNYQNFSIKNIQTNEIIATFTIQQMINCCGAAVSTSAQVTKKFRGKGLGKILNEMRKVIAYELGYALLICTAIVRDKSGNTLYFIAQNKILKDNKWTCGTVFNSRRTGNQIGLHFIKLEKPTMKLGFPINAEGKILP